MNKEITIAVAKITIIALAVLLAAASIGHAGDKPDELKQRILAQAQSLSDGDYAFTRTVKSEQTSNGKTEQHVTVDKFDPTKAGDARWTLVSVDGAPPSADDLAKYKKQSAKRRVPGYYRLAKYFGTNSTVTTDARGRTVFHFSSLPKDTALVMDSDVSSNTSADVSVTEANGTAFAEQVSLTVKPVRIKLLMKLERYESTSRYRMGPEGKPLLIENTAEMAGSGMGQEGKGHTVITYSDYRPAK
jgi:flagellar hook-associated protein FlgK